MLERQPFHDSDFAPVAAELMKNGFPTTRTPSGWTIDCSNDVSDFEVKVQQAENLTIFITPLAEIAEPVNVNSQFYKGVLELNHDMNFGKVGLTDDIVTLTRELPYTQLPPTDGLREVKAFSYAQERALASVNRLADRYHVQLKGELD